MSPTALIGVVLAGYKHIPRKVSHCQFQQIPLILTYALKSPSLSASEPLDVYVPLKFLAGSTPLPSSKLLLEICPLFIRCAPT